MGWRKRILRRPLLVAMALVAAMLVPASPVAAAGGDSQVAFYDTSLGLWRMEGIGDFYYGVPGDQPMLCDWNGDGTETVGLYRSTSGFLYLRQSNDFGVADVSIYFGIPEDRPVCGDWNGDGIDTVGVYRPSNRTFYLRNSNVTGFSEQEFTFGDGNGTPIAGDWNGDGKDSVGLWKQSNGYYELSNGNTSDVGPHNFLGNPGDPVVVADFDGNGRDTLGVYRTSNGRAYLSPLGEDQGAPLEYMVGFHIGTPVGGVTGGTPAQPVGGGGGGGGGSVPPGSISVYPGSSIQDAIDSAPNGSTFYIRAGTHRLQRFSPKPGTTIIGESGAVLNGARVLNGWSQDGGQWWVGGQSQEGPRFGVCENASSRCRYPEELFINNARLEHVDSRSKVGPGKWYFDYGADRIYIGDNPGGKTVETSITPGAVYGNAPDVTITGLIVEKYANPAQHGAIDNRRNNGDGGGDNWLISGNEVRWNHGVGVKVGKNARVQDNHIHNNGQLGVGAVGSGAVFTGNEIAFNGQLSFLLDWERGGSKFADTTNIQLLNNYVHHNWGPGLWADDNAKDMLFANNTVVANTKAGVYYEISYDAVIRDNYIEGNGFGFTPWLWGGGIVISSSSRVEIYGNTVVNNADGIGAVEQDRFETAKYGPHVIEDLYVHNNTITMSDGLTGVAQDVGNTAVFTSRNNRFENNTYNFSGSGNWFEWDNRQMTYDSWLGYGLN